MVMAVLAPVVLMSGCVTPPPTQGSALPTTSASSASVETPTSGTQTTATSSSITPAVPSPPAATPTGALPVDLNAALRDAARKNDVATAERLIDAGADVNAKDSAQESAYLLATSETPGGGAEMLELLLKRGANLDDKDSYNGTGLIRAADRGFFHICGVLLRAGISKDHVNRLSWQAIHEAIWLGKGGETHTATIRVLVAGGVQLDRPDGTGRTPLAMAQQRGPATAVDLLEKARQPYAGDPSANLLTAAAKGDANGVALALRAGANIEAVDSNRRTALLLAVTNNHVAVAQVLVAMGASPNALDAQHDTPWLVTGVTGSVEMLEALLPAHPDMTIRNRYGGISVIPAAERGHVDYVRRVVQTGINVNHVNDLGWTALLEAVILGDGGPRHQEIVRILLASGADRTIADKNGVTALRHAEQKGYTAIAALLRA